MDLATVEQFISQFGFPIVVCIVLAYFVWQLYKQSVARENKLYDELDACREVNAKAIETLAVYGEKLGTMQTDIAEIKNDVAIIMAEK
jgi:hypothetical protein